MFAFIKYLYNLIHNRIYAYMAKQYVDNMIKQLNKKQLSIKNIGNIKETDVQVSSRYLEVCQYVNNSQLKSGTYIKSKDGGLEKVECDTAELHNRYRPYKQRTIKNKGD